MVKTTGRRQRQIFRRPRPKTYCQKLAGGTLLVKGQFNTQTVQPFHTNKHRPKRTNRKGCLNHQTSAMCQVFCSRHVRDRLERRHPQSDAVSNLAWIEYAVEVPQELLNLWDDVALQWAREVSEHPAVVERVARYVTIHRELKSERPGPRRSALVDEACALKKTAIPLH